MCYRPQKPTLSISNAILRAKGDACQMLTARPSKPREKNNKMFPLCLPIPFLSLQKFHKNERTWYSGCSWHS